MGNNFSTHFFRRLYQSQNVKFNGKLVQNEALSRFQKLESARWEIFERSDYMKLLNSFKCKGTYAIEEIDNHFSPGYEPSTILSFALFKDGENYSGKAAHIKYSSQGVKFDIEPLIEAFKDAIVKDCLDS